MPEISALGPIDPTSVLVHEEEEKAAPWVVRKLVGSITGRIVMSSYETLRATGTNVICLSPWGDSSPFFLPCIRFRDLAVHTVIAATGGVAAVAAPVMGPVTDVVVSTLGDSILVEVGLHTGFELTAKVANELVLKGAIKAVVPVHSKRLETTGVKILLITLKYKQTMCDAALGFYRSSMHKDVSLFAAVKDYLAIEKGWFSPYLFASARRPAIPRSMKPDIIFCHGPFLSGDYRIGETLLAESASVITFCDAPPATPMSSDSAAGTNKPSGNSAGKHLGIEGRLHSLSKLNVFSRSRTPSPEPALTRLPSPPVPRRMVIIFLGLKPHRKLWTLSARPGESVINYILLNGCPAVVMPVKTGCPLVAWDTLTAEKLWSIEIPEVDGERSKDGRFEGVVGVIFEYLDLCIDWERVEVPREEGEKSEGAGEELEGKKTSVKSAVTLLVAAAIRSKDCMEARKELELDRSGIAIWRIP